MSQSIRSRDRAFTASTVRRYFLLWTGNGLDIRELVRVCIIQKRKIRLVWQSALYVYSAHYLPSLSYPFYTFSVLQQPYRVERIRTFHNMTTIHSFLTNSIVVFEWFLALWCCKSKNNSPNSTLPTTLGRELWPGTYFRCTARNVIFASGISRLQS